MKSIELKTILKSLVEQFSNNWNSKEREEYSISKLLELEWLNNGQHLLSDSFTKKLKKCYFSCNHKEITSEGMEHDYYIIHEPFGSKCSPDYLFITPFGIFGIEDKSSTNHKITWNTGTPGENKIITYFDKKENKVYLITSMEYGWTEEQSKLYREFTQKQIQRANEEFKQLFGESTPALANMGYYSRPMLTDKNNVRDIYDPEEINVDGILKGYLDNIW